MAASMEKFFQNKLKMMPVVEIELKSADRPRSIPKPPQSRPKKPSDPDLMDSDSMQSISSETTDGRPPGTGVICLLCCEHFKYFKSVSFSGVKRKMDMLDASSPPFNKIPAKREGSSVKR
jgi:hypothetical protein